MPAGIGRVALALATLGPLPLTLVGDTFLRLDLYLYTQCMVAALALAASARPVGGAPAAGGWSDVSAGTSDPKHSGAM